MRADIKRSAKYLFANWISPFVLSEHSEGDRAADNIQQVRAGLQSYCTDPVSVEEACETVNAYLHEEIEVPNARLGVYARSYRWRVVDGVVRCDPYANKAPAEELDAVATC